MAQASQQQLQQQQQQSAQQSALLLQQQQQQQQLQQLHEREGGQGSLRSGPAGPTPPFPPRLGRGGFQSIHSLSAQLGTRTSRLASTGGPGPDGQWAAAAQDAVGPPLHRSSPSASPTPLVGAEDITELAEPLTLTSTLAL